MLLERHAVIEACYYRGMLLSSNAIIEACYYRGVLLQVLAVKRPIHSELNRKILLCDVILDGKTE